MQGEPRPAGHLEIQRLGREELRPAQTTQGQLARHPGIAEGAFEGGIQVQRSAPAPVIAGEDLCHLAQRRVMPACLEIHWNGGGGGCMAQLAFDPHPSRIRDVHVCARGMAYQADAPLLWRG